MVFDVIEANSYQPVVNPTKDSSRLSTPRIKDNQDEGSGEHNLAVENKPQENVSKVQQIPLATNNAVVSAPIINAQHNTVNPIPKQLDAYKAIQLSNEMQPEKPQDDVLEFSAENENYEHDLGIQDAEYSVVAPIEDADDVAYIATETPKTSKAASHETGAVKQSAAETLSPQSQTVAPSHIEELKEQAVNEVQKKTDAIISGEGEGSAERTVQSFSVESPIAMFLHATHSYAQLQDNKATPDANSQLTRIKSLEKINISI